MARRIEESELIINPNGSIFHLHLKPENIADTIFLVGDQGRVKTISSFFDKIEFKIQNREFVTHTGIYKNKKISVISTGIGTDNIDIVVNELDALVNIDLKSRTVKEKTKSLNLIRIGTSGALQSDIPVDTPVLSRISGGLDGLLNFYAERTNFANADLEKQFKKHTNYNPLLASPYFMDASNKLADKFDPKIFRNGITLSAPGFYGPQGRKLRLEIVDSEINAKLSSFSYNNLKITNYEMECSAIYGLSKLLNHNALTICLIIANRLRKEYSKDYKPVMKKLIADILDII